MRTSPPKPKNKKLNVHPVHSKKNAEHDFKSQFSSTRGQEVVWVPRQLGHWLQRNDHLQPSGGVSATKWLLKKKKKK